MYAIDKRAAFPEIAFFGLSAFEDPRGYFRENFRAENFPEPFVQDNESFTLRKHTLRGLHFQRGAQAQAKLVRAVRGKVYDVVVDVRGGSPTFGFWQSFILSDENPGQLYIPRGFAHGFLTLEDKTLVQYKCSAYYTPEAEGGIIWNDPELAIPWPLYGSPFLSERDGNWPPLSGCEAL